jgi:hypothetical protein
MVWRSLTRSSERAIVRALRRLGLLLGTVAVVGLLAAGTASAWHRATSEEKEAIRRRGPRRSPWDADIWPLGVRRLRGTAGQLPRLLRRNGTGAMEGIAGSSGCLSTQRLPIARPIAPEVGACRLPQRVRLQPEVLCATGFEPLRGFYSVKPSRCVFHERGRPAFSNYMVALEAIEWVHWGMLAIGHGTGSVPGVGSISVTARLSAPQSVCGHSVFTVARSDIRGNRPPGEARRSTSGSPAIPLTISSETP